jgi:hypothetical protein
MIGLALIALWRKRFASGGDGPGVFTIGTSVVGGGDTIE